MQTSMMLMGRLIFNPHFANRLWTKARFWGIVRRSSHRRRLSGVSPRSSGSRFALLSSRQRISISGSLVSVVAENFRSGVSYCFSTYSTKFPPPEAFLQKHICNLHFYQYKYSTFIEVIIAALYLYCQALLAGSAFFSPDGVPVRPPRRRGKSPEFVLSIGSSPSPGSGGSLPHPTL